MMADLVFRWAGRSGDGWVVGHATRLPGILPPRPTGFVMFHPVPGSRLKTSQGTWPGCEVEDGHVWECGSLARSVRGGWPSTARAWPGDVLVERMPVRKWAPR